MFKASEYEYRFRYLLHLVIFVLGFTAPWNNVLHLDPPGPNAHVWGLLAVNLTQAGVGSLMAAFNVLLSVAIVLAVAGAFLRTWGSAYLGAEVVQSRSMHTGLLQDGPFRYVRNPLYLGTFLHTLALSLLMPRSGAIFCILAIGVLQLRLILAEEPFLAARLGAPYVAYCALAPRIWPAFRARVVANGLTPRWPQAMLGEIYMWGVAGSFAVLGWRYNAWLLVQCVIVSVGVSMVVRAIRPAADGKETEADPLRG